MKFPGREQVTGVVLAGGQSRRMGGVNKALVEHQGLPLYRYAVTNLRTCCDHVVININRDREAFESAGFGTIGDGEFKGQGPIAGIHAALSYSTTPFVAIAACDQLNLPCEVYQTLCTEVTGSSGVYACTEIDQVPTCAVLPSILLNEARVALESNALALMSFMRAHARPVCFYGVDFANLNHQSEVDSE